MRTLICVRVCQGNSDNDGVCTHVRGRVMYAKVKEVNDTHTILHPPSPSLSLTLM